MSLLINTVIFLPFLGAIFAYISGFRDKKAPFWVAEVVGGLLFVLSLILLIKYQNPISYSLEWFKFGEFSIDIGVYIDGLSITMLIIATGLGFLDIHFSHDYMKDDPHQGRYHSQILFFIGGMILLVSGGDLITLFVGWELMGVASYLLISFWHQKSSPADAGVSAFLFTKFGDIFIFASIGIIYFGVGTLELSNINHLAKIGVLDSGFSLWIAIFIFIGAVGKSGQFPLFPWLMRAMEGPTTVSALIHGATMVNSGIYIVARLFDFYTASGALIVVASVGAVSAFIGATSAMVQSEMKKVLAYSTMSHLSIAFVGLGVGSLTAGVTHLINHSIFKALLFLGAGAVMLSTHHNRDLWRLGGVGKKLNSLSLLIAFGALSLSGVAPFGGFFSKDAVIAEAVGSSDFGGVLSLLLIFAGLLSVGYIGRFWLLIFAGRARDRDIYQQIKPLSKRWILLPLSIMAIITLIIGCFQDKITEFASSQTPNYHHIPGLPLFMTLSIIILGVVIWLYYYKKPHLTEKVSAQPLMKSIHKLLLNGYFIEYLILWFVKRFILGFIAKGINWVDRNLIDNLIDATLPTSKRINFMFSRIDIGRSGFNSILMAMGVLATILTLLFMGGGR